MSVFPVARRNAMLDAMTASHLTAFDGDPAGAGVEISASRTAVTFGAAAAGVRTMSTVNPEIDVPAATQATHIAAMSAATAGDVTAVKALAAPFDGPGVIRVTAWTLTVSDPA
jgi:hypothetical protein